MSKRWTSSAGSADRYGRIKSQSFLPPGRPQPSLLVSPGAMAFVADSLPEGSSTTTLTTLLPSFTGFQGWLTLSLIGCVFGICQKVVPQAWEAVVDSFWVTIEFEGDDDSYRECLPASAIAVAALARRRIADHSFLSQTG